MDNRACAANASVAPPAAPGAPSMGYPKSGNPQNNDPATWLGPYWHYALGEEVRNLIVAGGLTPNINTLTQVRDAVQAMINTSLPADALVFKGVINCAANPNYPAADAGHVYRVSVAGKIGGTAGPNVEMGDILTCLTDASAAGDHATVGANWTIMQANIDAVSLGAVLKDDTRNLVIKNNPANIGGSLIITAGEVILKNGSGNPLVASNVALNDFQYIAANMDDGGAPPTNAWTYIWLFSNGSNVVGKYSASPTAPTAPNGYSYKALLAPWRVDGASLHRMRVHDREVSQYDVVFSGLAGPGGALAAQSLASFVPPMANMARLALGLSIDGATRWMQVRDTSVDAEFVALVNKLQHHPGAVGNVDGWYEFQETWLPLTAAQTVYWRSESTEAFYRMGVLGYRF